MVPGAPDAESFGIPADHINMVKYATNEDPGYQKISGHLQLMAEESSETIKTRWNKESKINGTEEPKVYDCT